MTTDRKQIPSSAIERLSQYYREIERLHLGGTEIVSSSTLARILHLKPTQVRKDLAYFGEFGRRGVGYQVGELHRHLRSILGLDVAWQVALLGVGNLGAALLSYKPFRRQGFNIRAAFDTDPEKLGLTIEGVRIRPLDRLSSMARRQKLNMAMLAVPANHAQDVATFAVDSGIRGIVNFATVKLRVPPAIIVRQVDLTVELGILAYHLRNAVGDDGTPDCA